MPIEMPPLRKRRNDIALLADHFLAEFSKKLGKEVLSFSEEAMSLLMGYEWPGNVRQLQNAIQFALIKCREKQIKPAHLPPEITDALIVSTGMPKSRVRQGGIPSSRRRGRRGPLARGRQQGQGGPAPLGVGRATLLNNFPELSIRNSATRPRGPVNSHHSIATRSP